MHCPICGVLVSSVKINAHIDANCPAPDLPVVAEKMESSSTTKKESPTPQRMAPLFAPKIATPKQVAPKITLPQPSFTSQKRTMESTGFNTTIPKKKKTDAAAESMPLAAKGKCAT